MIKQLQHKYIYTSIQKAQLIQNIREYRCELIIEQNIQTGQTNQWINFKHKSKNDLSFKVSLTHFKDPSSLMHIYKIDPVNDKFTLQARVQKIGQAVVQKVKKQFQYLELDPEQDQEYVQRKLVFGNSASQDQDSSQDEDSQQSERGIAPTEQVARRAKTAVINILNKKENQKLTSVSQVNKILKSNQYKIKIPENFTKDIVNSVCIYEKKSKYYTLRPEYVQDQDGQNQQRGRKKNKPNQSD